MGFLTPDNIAAYQREVHNGILSLNDEIALHMTRFPTTFIGSWRRFKEQWTIYYRDNSSTWDRAWGATMDAAERYSRMLAGYRALYTKYTGLEPSAPGVAVDSDPHRQQTLDLFKQVSNVIMVGAVVYGGVKLIDYLGSK